MLSRGNSDHAKILRRAKSTSSVPRLKSTSASSAAPDLTSTYRNAKTAAARAFGTAYGTSTDCANYLSGRKGVSSRKRKSEGQGSHFARRRSMAEKSAAASPGRHKTWSPLRSRNARASLNNALSVSFSSYGVAHGPALVSSQHAPEQMAYEHSRKWETMQPATMAEPFIYNKTSGGLITEDIQTPHDLAAGGQNEDCGKIDTVPCSNSEVQAEGEEKLEQLRSLMAISFPPRETRNASSHNKSSIDQDRCDKLGEGDEHGLTRKFSTLKRRLKRMPASLRSTYRNAATRSTSAQEQVPEQQVSAHRSHYFSSFQPHSLITDERVCGAETMPTDVHVAFEQQLPTPPIHGVLPRNSSRDHVAEQTFIEDFNEPSHVGSRLTSWTNSSGGNTVVQRPRDVSLQNNDQLSLHGDCDVPRISKTHSSVIRRLRISRRNDSSITDDDPPSESRRMYSALVRRIDSAERRKSQNLAPTPKADRDTSPVASAHEIGREDRENRSTIRLVPDSSNVQHDQRHVTLVSDCLRVPMTADRAIMSPSVYSFRPDVDTTRAQMSNLSLPERTFSHTGTAIVSESQPFAKWSLEVSPKAAGRPNTSADWRAWTSKAVSSIEQTGNYGTELLSDRHHERHNTPPRRLHASSPEPSSEGDDEISTHERPTTRVIGLRDRLAMRLGSNNHGNACARHYPTRVESRKEARSSQLSELEHELAQLSHILAQQNRNEPSQRDVSLPTSLNEATALGQALGPRRLETNESSHLLPKRHSTDEIKASAGKRSKSSAVSRRPVPEREMRRRRIMQQPATINESFLHDIRKGPYLPYGGETSPTRTSTRSLNTITPPRFARTDENAAPTSGQRMADLFLKARMKEQALEERSPSAFL